MAGTTLSDIIVPEIFTPYVINRTMELSAFFQSGIIQRDAYFDRLAAEPAQIHNMPFFSDLTGSSENIVEGQDLTPDGIKSAKDVSTTIRRGKMWAATDLSRQLADGDPLRAISETVAGFWTRDHQDELLEILKGVFACADMADHILDITTRSGKNANISATTFMEALQLLGDAQAQITAVCMHSATKTYLKQQNLISTERDSNSVEFDTYQGRRVVVDDGCPVEDGVYTTYLFGNGAIAYGIGNPEGHVATETDRDKKKGSGVNYLINRRCFIMHPKGIAWQNKVRANIESVSREELANGTNWARVYEPKQVKIIAFKHKLAG